MMRAARFYGKKDIRVDDVPRPEPGPGQVIVEIEWCGICGSDLHEYIIGTPQICSSFPISNHYPGPGVSPRKENPHPITKESIPITFGHEFCGRILSTPPDSKLQKGDAVMVDPRLYCSSCQLCSAGVTNGCAQWGFKGLSGGGGGFSEAIAVNESMCHILPETVSLEYAALLEPLTVAQHALNVSGVKDYSQKRILVLGGGPVGFAVCLVLRAWGVGKVFVSEPTVKRKGQIEEFADGVLDPMEQNVGEECRKLTEGRGVDMVFDCAGILPALEAGMDALCFDGIYVNVAGWEKPMTLPMGTFMLKQITVRASMSYTDEDFRQTVELFKAGKFKGFEKMVTDRISLEDVVTKGFEQLVEHKDDHIKIMVTPRKDALSN
jgi:2-desacetyl-2-hydroxyethyl bacteriochlorophyllide A dehydrogenase